MIFDCQNLIFSLLFSKKAYTTINVVSGPSYPQPELRLTFTYFINILCLKFQFLNCFLKCFSSSTMARSPIESIDFKLFQDDFKNIDQKFLQSVVSIFIIFNYEKSKLKKEFLMMTEKATYAYGEEICSWLSLKHDMTKPQRISLFNDFGQLGLGDEEDRDIPYLVAFSDPDSTRIKNIVAGEDYSLFLFKNGQVWGCGSNYNGVLGLGDTEIRSTPTKIPIENVKQIACSKFDSFLLANDGSSYYAWGKAKYRKWSSPKRFDDHPTGELGLGDENNRSILTKIPIENVQQIACSIFNSFSLVYDGSSYYAWGETKHDPNWSSPRKLNDSHSSFAYASVQSGKFYLKSVSKYYRRMFSGNWSENDQVIINDYSYEAYYAYIRMLHTGKIHINRQNITELVDLANCYGDERLMEYCQTFIRSDLNAQTMTTHLPLIIKYKMKEFYYELSHIAIEQVLPTIFGKTMKILLNFSIGFTIIQLLIQNNSLKQFLLMTKDATYAYGEEICSSFSLKHDMSKPQRISLLNDVKIVQVDYGRNFIAILTDDGQVFLASAPKTKWKTKRTLQLISNDNDRFKMIACGCLHLLLLRQDGHVFAMGNNCFGQITACGGDHSLSITNKGEIYSWGLNSCGQLGLGDENKRSTPCLVSFPNDDLIDIRIKDIVAGQQHSLFLFENGQLWGCGSDYDCQLGLGDYFKRLTPTKIPIENVQQIACSKFDSFSLAHDRSSYYAWGKTKYGKCYDVEFLIDKKRIKASKCYLKSVSEYYRRMFSGNWNENDQVTINDYSYETYYAFLCMLHTGKIYINLQNIAELFDLANCYCDKMLMKYCETFIRNDLDEQTMSTYLPLINKYEMKELHAKLANISI
ncbi:hypothetical protein HUG17_9082 [Dermatophagoides farinae]|uniref:BTB domain-containing protein n=1 Tax=Dermatophagoides farinae TaxID=6954 RepID=A0A9D4NSI5_DERFA|nr:hypothetical protein HUG17_9082 [Dermatophagoides farinae]